MGKFILWVVILVFVVNTWGSSGCLEEERIALLHVKAHMINNDTYTNSLNSWVDDKKSDCCKWERVKCSNITRRVIELDLYFVRDEIDGNWYINAIVFLPFKHLNSLDLERNKMAGVVENGGFDKLAKLRNLEELRLDWNNLNRSILSSLSQLSSLKILYLDFNPLDSPPNNPGQTRLSGLSNLEFLSMSYTKMEDNDVLSALNLKDFISLKGLDISYNKFKSLGPINDMRRLMKLEWLEMENNKLNSTIFNSLKWFPSLKYLDLSENDFHGPVHIQGVSSGINLQLHLNYIKCNMTKLLHFLATLPSIKSLHLGENNITSIEAIRALRNLSNIKELVLDYSYLHKDFLQSIGPMSSLKTLSLKGAQLGGTLPNKGWCELRKLQELELSDNQLGGMLPPCLGNLTSLSSIDLSQNMLIGNIGSYPLSTLASLKYLSISNNSFEIPSSFQSFANHTKLRVIHADGNKVISETELQSLVPMFQLDFFQMSSCIGFLKLPSFLQYQHDLTVLEIFGNNFEGEFPNWLLQNNTKLKSALMNSNAFTGTLKLPSHLNSDLQFIDFSENKLSGEIPNNLSSIFPYVTALNLSFNLLEGQIPSYLGNLKELMFLDLSNNSFRGSLNVLKLSNNKLEGEIVEEFGSLSSLGFLYLDGNSFTGTISETCILICSVILLVVFEI